MCQGIGPTEPSALELCFWFRMLGSRKNCHQKVDFIAQKASSFPCESHLLVTQFCQDLQVRES
jgi:hypothetical protein